MLGSLIDLLFSGLGLIDVAFVTSLATITPVIGTILLAVAMVYSSMMLDLSPVLTFKGFTLTVDDLCLLVWLPAIAVRFFATLPRLVKSNTGRGAALLAVFTVTVGLSLFRGVVDGTSGAAFEARRFVEFFLLAWYFSGFDLNERVFAWIQRVLTVTCIVIVGVCAVRWISMLAAPGAAHSWMNYISGGPFRVIRASQALFLAESAFFIFLPDMLKGRLRSSQILLLGVLSLSIMLLQHRTVWLAVAAALIYFLHESKRIGRARMVGLVAILLVITAVVLLLSNDLAQSLLASVTEMFADHSTFQWRLQGWIALLTQGHTSLSDILIGQPMGSGYLRIVYDAEVDTTPHNLYLQSYLRLGATGLTAFVWLVSWLLSRLRSLVGSLRPFALTLATLIVVQLVYFCAYGLEYEHGFVIGLGLALLRTQVATADHCEALEEWTCQHGTVS